MRLTFAQAAQALSYAPDWTDQALGSTLGRGLVELVVSAMREDESELLLLPRAHPMPTEELMRGLAAAPEVASASTAPELEQASLNSLAAALTPGVEAGLFDPLPLPSHVDDWLAQYREATQTVAECVRGPRAMPRAGKDVIYLLPIDCDRSAVAGSDARSPSPAARDALFSGLRDYCRAFFHGKKVELLPLLTLSVDARRRSVRCHGKDVGWRDVCPANGEAQPQGQLDASALLLSLRPTALRGRGASKSHAGGALPPDGFCVMGVTLTDLFSSDDDVFTGGLACLTSRSAVFSFWRYLEGVTAGVALHRACKTAVHEIAHMYGIGHCMHARCLMNGSGHLMEDFNAPPHLCPADLGKLVHVLGISLAPRYRALIAFCEAHADGFAEQGAWLRRALALLEADSQGGSEPLDGEGSSGPLAPLKAPHGQAKRKWEQRVRVGGCETEHEAMPLRQRLAARGCENVP